MTRPRRNVLIAVAIGLISELWPIPGAILAAVVFREGIHSSAPTAYIVLTFVLNFVLFAGPTYAAAARLSRLPGGLPRLPETRNARGPVKGVIYTESEMDEFKRSGQ